MSYKRFLHSPFSILHSSRGFTLMELMVVIIIMGILIALGLTSYKSTQIKSRDIRRKNDLSQIAKALELYYNDYGQYPTDTNSKIYGCGTAGASVCEWGSPFQTLKADGTVKTVYMSKLVGDMSSGRVYYYNRFTILPGSYNAYQLYTRLENTQDGDIPHNSINGKAQSYGATVCGTGILCNYSVTSTNANAEADSHTLQDD